MTRFFARLPLGARRHVRDVVRADYYGILLDKIGDSVETAVEQVKLQILDAVMKAVPVEYLEMMEEDRGAEDFIKTRARRGGGNKRRKKQQEAKSSPKRAKPSRRAHLLSEEEEEEEVDDGGEESYEEEEEQETAPRVVSKDTLDKIRKRAKMTAKKRGVKQSEQQQRQEEDVQQQQQQQQQQHQQQQQQSQPPLPPPVPSTQPEKKLRRSRTMVEGLMDECSDSIRRREPPPPSVFDGEMANIVPFDPEEEGGSQMMQRGLDMPIIGDHHQQQQNYF